MPNLLLCMTPGIGLNTWESNGSIKRELSTYVEYVKRGWNVKILTFDKGNIPDLPVGIKAVRFPNRRLLFLLPWTHRKLSDWADVIKTNQSVHAYLYTRAARYWKKVILLRCGYVHGEYLETIVGLTSRVKLYQRMEARAFQEATCCQVPTEELSNWVHRRYYIPENKITIVSNFADTSLFKPMAVDKKNRSVISVGRLVPVKQFDLLIKACAEIPGCTLTIIGEGPERQYLEKLAKELGVLVNFPGNMPNEELPRVLQEHMIFAITSKREGHPKALIEAMSCRMPCIGTDVVGIRNVIDQGKNGWLVSASSNSLREGITTLINDSKLRDRLSGRARAFVVKQYDFENCFSMEYDLVKSII